MLRSPTLNPCSPHRSIAASRIRATAVRSSDAERMFSTLNTRSAVGQAHTPSRTRKNLASTAKWNSGLLSRVVNDREFHFGEGKSVARGGEQAVAQRDEYR